jgi:hypothetical protein
MAAPHRFDTILSAKVPDWREIDRPVFCMQLRPRWASDPPPTSVKFEAPPRVMASDTREPCCSIEIDLQSDQCEALGEYLLRRAGNGDALHLPAALNKLMADARVRPLPYESKIDALRRVLMGTNKPTFTEGEGI